MAKHVNPEGLVSPKVSFPAMVVLALTAVATFLAGINPEMLAGLGQWAVPLAMFAGLLAQLITGYLKADPARAEASPQAEVAD